MRGSKKSVAASRVLISNQLHSAIRPVIEQLESRQLLSASVPLASTPAATPAVLTGTVIGTAGSYQNDGNTIAKVFDGNLTNYFDGPTASGDYAGLDLGVGNLITQISYAPRVGYASRMVGGVFQGSDSADFSSALTTLYTVTAAPASSVFTTVSVSNASPFRYVRYLAPDGSYGDVAEVQFTGYAPPTGETSLSGVVYADTNGNGKQDTGEAGLDGVTVALISNTAYQGPAQGEITASESAVTSSNGTYTFMGISTGSYTVTDIAAPGTTAGNQSVTVSAAQAVTAVNVGNATLAPIASAALTGTLIGTAGSYHDDGNTISKVFDGNLGDFFDGPVADGDYAGLDLGTATVVTQISFAPRTGYGSRMVGGIFQGSDSADFSGPVTTLYTVTTAPVSGVLTPVSVSSASPFRYVRYLAPDNSWGDVGEVKFTGYAPATGARQNSDGSLAVYGTNSADTIFITLNGNIPIAATLTDVNGVFDVFANVTQAVVAGLGGNDSLTYEYDPNNGAGHSNNIPVSILGGDGDDGISLDYPLTPVFVDAGAGNDTIGVSGDSGANATIHGGDGDDTIGAEGADQVYLDAYGDDGDDSIDFDLDAFGILNGGAGNDTLEISYINAFSDTVIGGDGNDTFIAIGEGNPGVLRFDGSDDSTLGEATVNLAADIENVVSDIDMVSIYGNATTTAITVEDFDGATIVGGSGNETITATGYAGLLLVNCGNGNNTVTSMADESTLNGGSGDDTFYASKYFPATINGGAGDDTAYVDPDIDVVTNVEHVIDYNATGGSVSGSVTGGQTGETIYLDANNNSTFDSDELSTTTDANGAYSFGTVPPGAYVVRQVLPTAFKQTSPAGNYGDHVTVTAGSTSTGNNFTDAVVPSTITVNGTAGDDTININFDNDSFTVDLNGATQTYSEGGVQNLVVNALGGNNTVTIDGTYEYDSATDLFENISVTGGSGNDTLHTSINDNAQANGQGINVNFTGGDGNDYADIEGGDTATINDGNGNDSFYTQAVQDNLSFGITAGNGNDGVVVGSVGGSSSQYGTANLGTGVDGFVNQDIDDHTTVNVDGHSLALSASTAEIVGHVLSASTGGGISGVQVYLDNNGDGTFDAGDTATTTDSNGVYVFDGLQPSSDTESTPYTVRVTLPTGYVAAPGTPVTQSESLAGGNGLSGIDFYLTNATGGSVSGSVTGGQTGETIYLDANNNSTFDSGELSTTTSSTGAYTFSNVPIGAYVVRQVLSSGYTQTTPAGNYGDHVTVATGSVSTGNNFADAAAVSGGSISGTVAGGVAGETIYLDFNNDSKLDNGELSTTTSSNGIYSFANVPAGAYIVRQVLPTGYTQTSPSGGLGIHLTVVKGSNFTNENFTDQSSTVTRLAGVTIGTPGSYNNDGNTIAKATDGILTNYYDGAAGNGDWVGYDLGSSESISQVEFTPRDGYESRMIGGEFQISTTADFSSGVTTLYTITAAPATGVLTTVAFSTPVTARYIRYLSPNSSHGDIAEFQVFG